MLTKRSVKLGPWSGGLNRRDTGNELKDNELVYSTNCIFRDDGTIQLRPPQVNFTSVGGLTALGANEQIIARKILRNIYNFFKIDTNLLTTVVLQFSASSSWTSAAGGLTAWAGGTLTGIFSDICYYNGFYYIINAPGGAVNGKKAVNVGSAWTDVATLPKGTKCFIHKDRMWVWDATINRLYWSKATDPTVWSAPDGGFVDIGPNDGDNIQAVVVQNNTFYIFKMTSTWQFGYSSDPAVDGFLQVVSPDTGAYEAITARNAIYVAKSNGIYEFVNNRYILVSARLGVGTTVFQSPNINPPLNIRFNLMASNARYVFVIGLEETNGVSQDIFVYDLNNGTWTEWQCQSVGNLGSRASGSWDQPYSIIADNNNLIATTVGNKGITGVDFTAAVINRLDKCGQVAGNQFSYIPYTIQTKNYDFGTVPFWKKHYRHYMKFTYVNTSSQLVEQWLINITGEQTGSQLNPSPLFPNTLQFPPVGLSERILVKVFKFFTINWFLTSNQNTLQASNVSHQLILEHIDLIIGTDSAKQALQKATV